MADDDVDMNAGMGGEDTDSGDATTTSGDGEDTEKEEGVE